MLTSYFSLMSKLLSAWLYIADSKQPNLVNSFHVLSSLIGRILEGKYADTTTHSETIHFKNNIWPKKVIITGISIWDGKMQILGKSDVAECIRWISGKIMILCEWDSQSMQIDMSEVANIVEETVIKPISPTKPAPPLLETANFFPIMLVAQINRTPLQERWAISMQ